MRCVETHPSLRHFQEELNELKVAIDQNDIVEIADALADLQVVIAL